MRQDKPATIESYVVEWFVEDAGRYERLRRVAPDKVVREQRPSPSLPHGSKTSVVSTAIITCLLEVPLPAVDGVTTALRQGNVRGSQYLKTCSEHADDAAVLKDRSLYLERYVEKLQDLVVKYAKIADAAAGPRDGNARRHEVDAVAVLQVEAKMVGHEIAMVRGALDERKTEVAAKLLAALPDGDW